MHAPLAWKDKYYISKDRTVLTEEELHIPGLEMFGKHTIKNAVSPIAPHYHRQCFEFTIVTKGVITFSVDNIDYTLKGGDLFITQPNEIHSTNMMPLPVCELIWFQITIDNPTHILFLNEAMSNQLLLQLSALKEHRFHMANSNIIKLADEAFQAAHMGDSLLASSYLTLLLRLLVRDGDAVAKYVPSDIQQAVDYILAHLTELLPLEDLARLCNLSVSSFKQKFQRHMGISPRNYINMQKIEFSKQLLLSGYSITDTSMKLNFNTSNYFATVFKKYNFYSPSDYIKKKSGMVSDFFIN